MALCIKETDKMIGDVGLHFFETNFLEVEIGYTIHRIFRVKDME
jgi:RimJ/RimL family protein N-acetyltransferase